MTVQELTTLLGFEVDETALNKFENGLKKAEKVALGVSGAVLGLGVAAVKFASDYDESLNKVNVAFGDSADTVTEWSKTTLKSFGLASGTALDAAALFGDMGTAMKVPEAAAADMATTLVGLSADLASFKNVSQEYAAQALKGIYTGEGESLKNLGVVMNQTTLAEFALSQGITKRLKDMSQAELVQLRYKFVMDATAKAQGDFARTSGGVANQTRLATEGFKEVSRALGTYLLPAVAAALIKFNGFISVLVGLDEQTKKNVLIIAGLAAAIYPAIKAIQIITAAVKIAAAAKAGYLIATGAATASEATSTAAKIFATTITGFQTAATWALTAAQWALNIALSANPIALIIIGIVALVAVVVLAYKNSETFRNILNRLWEAIKSGAATLWEFGKVVWEVMQQAGAAVYKYLIQPVMNAIGLIKKAVSAVKGFFGGGGAPAAGSTGPGAGLGSSGPGGGFSAPGGGGTQNYNVDSSVSIQVPAGTPEQQQQFIQQDVRKVVREENQRAYSKTRRSAGRAE